MSAQESLGAQFHGFTGGPEEARVRHEQPKRDADLAWAKGHPDTPWAQYHGHGLLDKPQGQSQGQLFDPEKIPAMEAHQQTPDQFAADPRTWWHGRVTKGGPQGRLGGSGVGRGEGFHAGTEAAARQRVGANIKRRGLKEGMAGHMYPLRITGPVEGPENLQPDVTRHRELGPTRYGSWGGQSYGGRTTGYLYENKVENAGSISVGAPQRKGFLSTHREMVQAAQQRGEKVHPLIAWAAKKAPEHTEEKIKERWSSGSAPQGRQQGLHEQFDKGEGPGWSQADPRRGKAFEELYPDREKTFRTSYTTAGGQQKHVFAFSTEQPGSALLGKQWRS